MSLSVRGIDLMKRGLGSMRKKKRSAVNGDDNDDVNDDADSDGGADISI